MSEQRLKGWKKQETAFNYAEGREFGPGLRAGGLYADLGVAKATGGQFHAHVIKVKPEKHDHGVRPVCTAMTMTFNSTMSSRGRLIL